MFRLFKNNNNIENKKFDNYFEKNEEVLNNIRDNNIKILKNHFDLSVDFIFTDVSGFNYKLSKNIDDFIFNYNLSLIDKYYSIIDRINIDSYCKKQYDKFFNESYIIEDFDNFLKFSSRKYVDECLNNGYWFSANVKIMPYRGEFEIVNNSIK